MLARRSMSWKMSSEIIQIRKLQLQQQNTTLLLDLAAVVQAKGLLDIPSKHRLPDYLFLLLLLN